MASQSSTSTSTSWSSALSLTYRLILVPIGYTLRLLYLILLLPIAYVLRIFLVWPVVQVGRLGKALIWLPVTLVLKFEAILIYLACAGVLGIIAGCVLYTISTSLDQILGLKRKTSTSDLAEHESPLRQIGWSQMGGRTIADYRAYRQSKKIQHQVLSQQKKVPSLPSTSINPAKIFSLQNNRNNSSIATATENVDNNVMYMNGRDGRVTAWSPKRRGPLSEETILEEDDSDSSF